MSFSYDAKTEICTIAINKKCCAIAECYGILLYCNTYSSREIKIITGNRSLQQRLIMLFDKAFATTFDVLPDPDKTGKRAFIINDKAKLAQIYDIYGFESENLIAHHVNLGVLEDDCCRRSFIRGVFLAGGAITDPDKRYHLELVTSHYHVSRQTYSLLLEMGLFPKETSRTGNYITYFKQSAGIEDFLTMIGAPVHAMRLMSAKIEKDMRNSVNRKVNCDTANVSKIVDASVTQIEAIKKIETKGMLDTMPEKIRQTAFLRMDNPEMSIKELADISSPPVTKSCLNHRLRRIIDISNKI